MPYTIIVYPLVFLAALRLWSVSHRHGYVTPADFVRGRYGSPHARRSRSRSPASSRRCPTSRCSSSASRQCSKAIGINGHWPLVIAFAVLAAYTYQSGLRAPALIAFVKDVLIYVVVLVAVIYIPIKLGGCGNIFDAADEEVRRRADTGDGDAARAVPAARLLTLALGSALALFLYPHSVTGVLASRSRDTIKRNMAALPAYSLLLGLIALLGYMAIAAGVDADRHRRQAGRNTVVPLLFDKLFPAWFAGIAFAAIAIGALVPAAIMSIAAANLFTRNIYTRIPPARRDSPREEAQVSKLASLVVKFGALLVIIADRPAVLDRLAAASAA